MSCHRQKSFGRTRQLSGFLAIGLAVVGLSACRNQNSVDPSLIVFTGGNESNPTAIQVSGPSSIVAGECSTAITLSWVDGSNTSRAAPWDLNIGLSGLTTGAFYSDAACTNAITTLSVAQAQSSITFYFKTNTAGDLVLISSDATAGVSANLAGVTLGVTVLPASASAIIVGSGDGQTGTVSSALGSPLIAHVTDAFGNAISGATVDWTVVSGGGSLGSASSTDNAGNSSVNFTLGGSAGAQVVRATIHGTSTFVNFTATAASGTPAGIAVVSGNSQSGTAGSALGTAFTVVVTDSHSNPVSGVTVDWAVASGGGSLSTSSSTTNGSGNASSTLTLGGTVGSNTVTATIHATSTSVSFTATGVAGAAANIAIVSGNSQSATVGSTLGTAFTVVVTDSHSNPVSGVTVDWAVASGGGSLSASSSTTNGSGNASSTLTLGTTAGSNSVTATIHATSTSVSFTATGVSGAAASIGIISGNSQTGVIGFALAQPFSVKVYDSHSNAVSGVTVDWTVDSGGGSLSASSGTTSPVGLTSTTLTLGAAAGANSVTATVSGTAFSVTFSATAVGLCGASAEGVFQLGSGSEGSPYIICTAAQLNSISDNSSYMNKTFKLGATIDIGDLGATAFNMIGSSVHPFTGHFIGNAHTIQNFWLVATGDDAGMFGVVGDGATIEQLTLSIAVAGVVGGSFNNIGGLIGHVQGTGVTVTNNYIIGAGPISGTFNVGGLIGYAENNTTVSYCRSSVNISGGSRVGGLIGFLDNSGASMAIVSHSRATGSVTLNTSFMWYVGGLIGEVYKGAISTSFATGAVTGDWYAGGLIGNINSATTINDSYARGSVSASNNAGGLVGDSSTALAAQITHVYASGAVTSAGTAACLIGGSGGAGVTDSFYDSDTCSKGGGGTARNTANMQTAATFSSTSPPWDGAIWNLVDGSYPTLDFKL